MIHARTRSRRDAEPALATGPLNGAYQLSIQDCYYRELTDTHAVQSKEDERDRMHEVLVRMETWIELWARNPQHGAVQTANYPNKPQGDVFSLSLFHPKKQQSSRWSRIDSYALINEDHRRSHQKRQPTTITPRTETHPLSASTISNI